MRTPSPPSFSLSRVRCRPLRARRHRVHRPRRRLPHEPAADDVRLAGGRLAVGGEAPDVRAGGAKEQVHIAFGVDHGHVRADVVS